MRISDYLDSDEIRTFTRRSDLQATKLVILNWLSIALIFSIVYLWTNPLTVVLGILLMGGRQLGLGILMHEAGHRSLFETQSLNQKIGQWLCAYPIMADVNTYAASHREHHLKAGSQDDPDLPNYDAYPVTAQSFKRKVIRDFTGQTGLKLIMSIARGAGDMMVRNSREGNHLIGGLTANVILFITLTLLASPWLYLIWFGAYVTSYTWVARIRQIAEHGATPDLFNPDPRLHTRTTIANWLERALFCPNYVNYHCEHHFAASVPCYNLPHLHKVLKKKRFYEGHGQALAQGYFDVIRQAVPEWRGASA